MNIRWTGPAAVALKSITDHIARDNPPAAYRVAQRIKVAVAQLAEHPRLGRVGRVRDTYELIIPGMPYIVAYRVGKLEVQILSVYHTSRKWPEAFDHM